MWVFCGLGNPGKEYEKTRHNFGFMVVSHLAKRLGLRFKGDRSLEAEIARFGEKCILLKPLTYMNLSGKAVKRLLQSEGLKPENLLLAYDDLDLPLGRLKILPKGGAGGHNGVRSVIAELGINTFPRVKLGIGRPPLGITPREYVLSPFGPEEWPLVEKVRDLASQALWDLLSQDLLKVMTKYNSLSA